MKSPLPMTTCRLAIDLTKIYAESGKVHAQYFDFSLPQRNVQGGNADVGGPRSFQDAAKRETS